MNLIDNYFDNCKVMALDIETTGLDSNKNSIILVGILSIYDTSSFSNYFCDNLGEEKKLLQFIIDKVESADLILTYNGASFDIPFINNRLEKFGFEYKIPAYKNFDLYRIFRSSYLKSILPNMKQKTMETFIGINHERTDKISGYESVLKYLEYLKTGSQILKEEILLHNKDDVLQLEQLLSLFKKIDVHKSMFLNGFPIIYKQNKIYLESIKLKANSLNISGQYYGFTKEAIYFSHCYNISFSKFNNKFAIEVPIYLESNFCYLDIKEFHFSEIIISELAKYPSYINGYLIISENRVIRHNEINLFIKLICKDFLIKI